MAAVILIFHLLFALGIVGVVLLQRSEGGGLGIGGGGGGGGGMGGLVGSRSAASFLTRATGTLAALFFCTSIILSILSGTGGDTGRSIITDGPAPVGGVQQEGPAAAEPVPADQESGPSGPAVPVGE